ncbi:glycosyl transferase, group 1 family [Roseibium sp. TrichSKD4]|uniref:glycosyl transferase group 1 family n=1 Tax=Roseibium sp. TrichSKD4 TaxID=744980 RepID=UPI0001E563A9|nr:glycosyl transferase group 1 family [Roseibium sp. TrichSKD4]EFO33035.1 glycosyl transferase, group 1 family [Roseibium sp. TrichSKD4]
MTSRPAKQIKVALVCGTRTPGKCGVGDYSNCLADALRAEGVSVEQIEMKNWSLLQASQYKSLLADSAADLVHVQYPSLGYKRSILPAVTGHLGLKIPTLVTLHEFQVYRAYWRFIFAPIATGTSARVFTRSDELDRFAKTYPARKGQDVVIPIGSNIPKAEDITRKSATVAFFGLFWPGKGLEQFLEFAILAKSRGIDPSSISVIGAPVQGKDRFHAQIREKSRDIGFNLYESRSPDEVARLLAEHEFAYLPFPTGADERRGSMAAVLVNGCKLLTTFGNATPQWIKTIAQEVSSPADALRVVTQPEVFKEGDISYPKNFADVQARYDWRVIARRHIELYETLGRA